MADEGRVPLDRIFPRRRGGMAPPLEEGAGAVPGEKRGAGSVVKMGFERHHGVSAVIYYFRGLAVDVTLCRGDEEAARARAFYLEGTGGEGHLVDVAPVLLPPKRRGRELLVLAKTHEGLPDGCVVCWDDEEEQARRELAETSYQGWGNAEEDTVHRFVVEYPREAVPRMGYSSRGRVGDQDE